AGFRCDRRAAARFHDAQCARPGFAALRRHGEGRHQGRRSQSRAVAHPRTCLHDQRAAPRLRDRLPAVSAVSHHRSRRRLYPHVDGHDDAAAGDHLPALQAHLLRSGRWLVPGRRKPRPELRRRIGASAMSERSSIRRSTRLSGAYVRLAALGIAMAVASLAVPAQADFYSLAGRFECLDKPAGSCGGPGRAELLPPPAPKPGAKETTTAIAAPRLDAVPAQQPTAPHTQASASRERGPIETIAAAIRRGQVSAADRATLQRLSQAGNARATELLAWCDYKGIGAAPDPVAAYVLYGIAALGGVPTARQNQAVIYEYALTSEQRQKVLDMQNEVPANP